MKPHFSGGRPSAFRLCNTLSPGRSGLKEVNMKIGQILGTFFLLTSTIQKQIIYLNVLTTLNRRCSINIKYQTKPLILDFIPPIREYFYQRNQYISVCSQWPFFYHTFYVWGSIGMLLWSIEPSTATGSLSHCHNRNLHVFFAHKQYSNHWYSQYIDALIEGGNIADACIFVWLKNGHWLQTLIY